LFIAFIGMINSGIVVKNDATLVGLGSVTRPETLLALVGLIIIVVLMALRVKGNILLGILITTLIGVFVKGQHGCAHYELHWLGGGTAKLG